MIPKRFKLFGRTIEVVYTHDPFVERPDASAFASYRLNKIELNPARAEVVAKEVTEQSFYHELTHFVLYHSGSSYKGKDHSLMHQDEEFVDLVSNLLHQAITTFEY